MDNDEIFHSLPAPDPFMKFTWRIRVDVRSAIDLPLNRKTSHGLPETYVELGWTLKEGVPTDEN